MSRREQFDKYIDLTLKVRSLSSPLTNETEGDKGYRDTLLENFKSIRTFAVEKKEILENHINPLLNSRRKLTKGEIDDLKYFYSRIFNAYQMENLDLPLTYRIADRILLDADKKENERDIIAALDAKVEISFAYMHMIQRLTPVDKICYYFRDEGLKAANRLLEYLPKSKFRKLPDETSKQVVLVNSRYISALFDRSDHYSKKTNRHDLSVLERSLALAEDPFYLREAPHYNWRYHEFRALQYITDLAQFSNVRGMDGESLEKLYGYARRMDELWHSSEVYYSRHAPRQVMDLYISRIDFLTGRISGEDYRATLYRIVESREDIKYDFHDNLINVFVMCEYLMSLKEGSFTGEEKAQLQHFYDRMVGYLHRMPRKGSISFALSFLSDILKLYKEVRGEGEFEEICLKLMAALHPLTYIHSLSVAEFSRILAESLLEKEPERFIGFKGLKSREEVLGARDQILDFAYHAALTHDIGKLFVTEIITTYDRKLFDEEFQMIRSHPVIGAYVLSKHEGTRDYVNTAKYHHLYYDGSQGYPLEDISHLPERVFIEILACADCLDAATDSVGRSYKEGKSLEEFLQEIKEGSGTRYAPYVVDLFNEEKVLCRIQKTLLIGRDENYQKTYHLLKD